MVFVSHELPSLFAIADDGIFLDADSKAPIAHGAPRDLRESSDHPTVRAFLRRENPKSSAESAPATNSPAATTPA